jgi:hypothetical protein
MKKNIGLINIEPKIENTAYMQIAHHHREKGDGVEWYDPDRDYDKIYCSSLFTFTDKSNIPQNAVCGGTGFDLTTTLPFDCDLDYSLYPACVCSYLWFSRGCIRKCKFCIVHEKEGYIRSVTPKNLNPNGKYIKVQDNNFFANPDWKSAMWKLWGIGQPVEFLGIDVRAVTIEQCKCLKHTKHHGRLKIAWDNPKCTKTEKGIKRLIKYVSPSKIMCYVLTGFNSTEQENIDRIRALEQYKISPYVMCMNRQDPEQKKFQKWVNGFAYRRVKYKDFDPNFKSN